MLRFRLLLIAAALLFTSAVVRAEGPGIRLGERLVLHPGIAAEFRWDSNVFFESSSEANAFVFRLLPSLDLATRPPQRGGGAPHAIDFRLHLGADYNEFITTDATISEHRSVGVQAGMLLTLFPLHPFTLDIFDNYVRTSQPPYFRNALYNIDRDTNEVGARFRWRPGGRRFELDVMYAFGLDFFEVRQFKELDVTYHRANLRASWKFFPKTALYIDVSEVAYLYVTPGMINHPNSFPLRAIAGLNGLLTAKLSLNAWVGYGNGFYQTTAAYTSNPNTAIGGLELTWKPFFLSTGLLGYRHDFINSLIGSFYDTDTAYIGWRQLLWRFSGLLDLRYSNIRYQDIQSLSGLAPLSRTDNFVQLNVRLEYPFKDWLILGAGYVLQSNTTDAQLTSGPTGLVPLNYTKHEVFLRLSVLY